MTFSNLILVIPSSVYVSAPFTALVDAKERETQYLDALSFFIKNSVLQKLVICDNSGYVYSSSVMDLAKQYGKEVELLAFDGNKELVRQLGKGYGEGEIMDYVLRNSKLMMSADNFIKITGRLKVLNINRILDRCRHPDNYFTSMSVLPDLFLSHPWKHSVDTRIYLVSKQFFSSHMQDIYKEVRDGDGYFLEHVYYNRLKKYYFKIKRFPILPLFEGMSGSTKIIYGKISAWRWKLKEIIYFLLFTKKI